MGYMEDRLKRKGRIIDMTGLKFTRLTVLENVGKWKGKTAYAWKCICDCGTECIVMGTYLRNGDTRSCGCLSKEAKEASKGYKNLIGKKVGTFTVISEHTEMSSKRERLWVCECTCKRTKIVPSSKLNLRTFLRCSLNCPSFKTHSRFYKMWLCMLDRCYNATHKAYKDYGGRGIFVCEEWRNDYWSFYNWAAPLWKPELTLDRINNDGEYSSENCKFSTDKEQQNNRRNTVLYTINGITKNFPDWCKDYGMCEQTVRGRMNRLKWDILKSLTTPKYFSSKDELSRKVA